MTHQPLLTVGTFGTHLIEAPSGRFIFTGTVPTTLKEFSGTYDEGYTAFKNWFKGMSPDDKKLHAPNLRNDVFSDFANSGTFT